jgi:glycosyltransferase involved in cell wall biosynthesis
MVGAEETGNETYIKGIVDGFTAGSEDLDVVVYHIGSPWMPDGARVHFRKLSTGNPLVRLGAELPVRSLRDNLDVLHMTYASPIWSAAPLVVTVHDISYATNPEWFSPRDVRVLSTVVPWSIRKAAQVITVSESARRLIVEHYGVPEDKITAIPNGPGPAATAIDEGEARKVLDGLGLRLERPYLLAVGNLQPRKNLVRLFEAFRTVAEGMHHEVDLVVVGPERFRAAEVLKAASGSLRDRIHFTGYISDRQLAACYRCSIAFVFPSLYEGFGLPVLEAMAHGIPVACSDVEALREVSGDAAILFNPTSIDDIAQVLDKLLRDASLRQRLSSAGPLRAAAFTWEKSARHTIEVYRKARR